MSLLRTFVVPLLVLICGALAIPTPDLSLYRDFNVSRGSIIITTFVSQDGAKPYLLFLHGFPSSSYDWRYQIEFFSNQGYGLIVPDMLGYGGTARPLETELTRAVSLQRTLLTSWIMKGRENKRRLANTSKIDSSVCVLFCRILGSPWTDLCGILESGYRCQLLVRPVGILGFFSQDNAPQIVSDNVDSLFSLLYATDPRLSITHWSPAGTLQAWLESKSTTEYFLSPETDNLGIPESNATIYKPTFFAGALRDYMGIAALMRAAFFQYAPHFTFQDYDADHWVMIQKAEEVNRDLLEWLEGSVF
ncbi:Alpha/Beta hydrolase protein [Mucidula mucida]|nr:Alpha/Beta hydrolase protein [Mucidula mucida]